MKMNRLTSAASNSRAGGRNKIMPHLLEIYLRAGNPLSCLSRRPTPLLGSESSRNVMSESALTCGFSDSRIEDMRYHSFQDCLENEEGKSIKFEECPVIGGDSGSKKGIPRKGRRTSCFSRFGSASSYDKAEANMKKSMENKRLAEW
ncbi:unnamed protein product [Protopolystoma xenopodis]|uniref:Uncharacterized protein n=1 Tax=Protopolystoma xenopodis TaxID=117903 RepID=A0A448WDM4_9PLAT|nr:unnamed protein product [Protopolystoma xenopodis]